MKPTYLNPKTLFRSDVHDIYIQSKDDIAAPFYRTTFHKRCELADS